MPRIVKNIYLDDNDRLVFDVEGGRESLILPVKHVIPSFPPENCHKVTNIYYDPTTKRVVVLYDTES